MLWQRSQALCGISPRYWGNSVHCDHVNVVVEVKLDLGRRKEFMLGCNFRSEPGRRPMVGVHTTERMSSVHNDSAMQIARNYYYDQKLRWNVSAPACLESAVIVTSLVSVLVRSACVLSNTC